MKTRKMILLIIILVFSGAVAGYFLLNNKLNNTNPVQAKDSIFGTVKLLKPDDTINTTIIATKDVQIKTFLSSGKGWGYDIYLDGTPYIHQPHIPAVSGNNGFKSKEAAERTAGLVVYKIMKNIMPPSVSIAELDSIGVLK